MYENISSANRWYFNITELMFLVRLEGFEPPVFKFVAWYSIQLNYRRIFCEFYCFFLFASFTCSIILWFFFLFKSFLEFFEFFFKISCQIVFFVVYYISIQVISRCSAVGSARGLGPWGRRFDPCRLDHTIAILRELKKIAKVWKSINQWILINTLFLCSSQKFYKKF